MTSRHALLLASMLGAALVLGGGALRVLRRPPPTPTGASRSPLPLPADLDAYRAANVRATTDVARERLISAASGAGTPDAVRFLAEVASQDPRLGAQAAAALGRVREPASSRVLGQLATGDAPPVVRANAARALGEMGPAATPALAGVAMDAGAPPRVRQEAALALARTRDPAAAPVLVRALDDAADDRSAEPVRISLVQALAAIGTPEARAALERHRARPLSDRESVVVRQALAFRPRSP